MGVFNNDDNRPRLLGIIFGVLLGLIPLSGGAKTQGVEEVAAGAEQKVPQTQIVATTIETLDSFVDLRNAMMNDIKEINKQIGNSKSDAEKQKLRLQLDKLESDLRAVTRNFENIAAGVDITSLREEETQDFSFQRELLALLKPASMK